MSHSTKDLTRPTATEVFLSKNPKAYRWSASTGRDRAEHFHLAMGLPVKDKLHLDPSVTNRVLRCKLMLEEVLETFKAMGVGLALNNDGEDTGSFIENGAEYVIIDAGGKPVVTVYHIEGSRYDPIETADGLADVKVIANGTAVALGIPMEDVDFEVFASNMTKLDEDGKPRINMCLRQGDPTHDCDSQPEACEPLDPRFPIGKLLKPDTYTPANILRVLMESSHTPLDQQALLAYVESTRQEEGNES